MSKEKVTDVNTNDLQECYICIHSTPTHLLISHSLAFTYTSQYIHRRRQNRESLRELSNTNV